MDQATDKIVYCPWCGNPMEEATSIAERAYFYICKTCKAQSPKCDTNDIAYRAASASVSGAERLKDVGEVTRLRSKCECFRIEMDNAKAEMNNAKGQAQAYSDCVKVAITEAIKAAIQSV